MTDAILDMNELLGVIKRHIKVTWDHSDDDIIEIIEDGIAFLESRTGKLPFYLEDRSTLATSSRRLLKAYCRYHWNGSDAYFEADYLSDILNLQILAAVDAVKQKDVNDNETNQ